MSTDAEAAKLERDLETELFRIVADSTAPGPARDEADRILTELLNRKLATAIKDFQAGTMRLLELVGQLGVAVAKLKANAPGAGASLGLENLIERAAELHRQVHDAQGMRTTHTTQQEAEAPHPDEEMLSPRPPDAPSEPVTAITVLGPTLQAPTPINSTRYDDLVDEYMRFFAGAGFKSVEAERIVEGLAQKWLSFQPRYEAVGKPLGIPWWFIAGIHMLESTFNFGTHLHNGDSLKARTFRVPAGRPTDGNPPYAWEVSARDALVGHRLAGLADWSLPRALYRWEAYNGFGYRPQGVASPYLWSFSTIYRTGKFVADGVFDASAESKQCGAATLLKFLHLKGHVPLGLDRGTESEKVTPEVVAKAEAAPTNTTDDTPPPVETLTPFEAFVQEKFPTGLKSFKPSEFLMLGSEGGNELPPRKLWDNAVALIKVLEELRQKLDRPIVLTSVYRSPEYNKKVGGEINSQHLKFCAADFVAKGGTPGEWADVLKKMRADKFFQGGIGVYSRFVHVDTSGWNRDWVGS